MQLNVLDLFSGIGGFSVGLEATGKFKTIGFCEQDKFCHKVLHKHWSDVPIYEDIKKLDGTKIKADVIVGGFPCQSFSIAGKQKGKDDERYLWDEMFRVIKEVKPRWIIGENVQNLINIADGQILQGIHNDLESENFEVQTFNITASSQGAWHKRSRVWIVAANTKCLGLSKGCKKSEKFKREETPNKFTDCNQGSQFRTTSNELETIKDVWNTDLPSIKSSPLRQRETQFRGTNTPAIQCKKTWWQTQSELCGVPHGVQYELDKDRVERIKALGNSIVPQIVTEIGQAIIKAEEIN
jgi:DNA (cytosine-5)-methyltransferase 1